MQSCMLQMTCSIPIFNDRKLNELYWLLYIHLYNRGNFGPGESPLWVRRNLNRGGGDNIIIKRYPTAE